MDGGVRRGDIGISVARRDGQAAEREEREKGRFRVGMTL